MAAPTTIPTIDGDGFAIRQVADFPKGWASPEAGQPGGVLYALFKTLGSQFSFSLSSLAYALGSMRIQTAVNGELDLASQDFFGNALPRNPGESDAGFRARLLAALDVAFGPLNGATRASVVAAIVAVTGVTPRVIEPWRPPDTGVIDGAPGAGMMFMDCDCAAAPAIITDPGLAYQGFIESALPSVPVLAGNPLPCMDVGENASGLYADTAGSSMFDFDGSVTLGAQEVYNAINAKKVFGTVVWVNFELTSQIIGVIENDGGVAILNYPVYPISAGSLPAGSLWANGLVICIVPGITPDPSAPPVFFGISATALEIMGGGNFPTTKPVSSPGQFWNNGGVLCIA